jgi:hypothetical protein
MFLPVFQAQHGWERDLSLLWVVYAWVFFGSLLFLGRREAGRRILRGASIAFAAFFTIVLLMPPFESPVRFRAFCISTIVCSLMLGAVLSLRLVRTTMREAK